MKKSKEQMKKENFPAYVQALEISYDNAILDCKELEEKNKQLREEKKKIMEDFRKLEIGGYKPEYVNGLRQQIADYEYVMQEMYKKIAGEEIENISVFGRIYILKK